MHLSPHELRFKKNCKSIVTGTIWTSSRGYNILINILPSPSPPPKKNAHLGDELVTERTYNVCNLDEIYFLLKCTLYNDYIGDLYQSVIKVKIVFRI